LIIYPNFSPCYFSINLEFYNKNGKKIHELPKFLHVDTTKSKLHKIDFNEIISKIYELRAESLDLIEKSDSLRP